MSKNFKAFKASFLFLFTFFILQPSLVFAVTVVVGNKEMEVETSITVEEFLVRVQDELGYDISTVVLAGKKVANYPAATLDDLGVGNGSRFTAEQTGRAPLVFVKKKKEASLEDLLQNHELDKIIRLFQSLGSRMAALDAASKCSPDGRNAIYVAARLGRTFELDQIRGMIGEFDFQRLISQYRREVHHTFQGDIVERQTVLHAAVRSGNVDTVAYLLRANPALKDVRNSHGCTAYDAALMFGHRDNQAMLDELLPTLADPGYVSHPKRPRVGCLPL